MRRRFVAPLVIALGVLVGCDGEKAPPFPEGQGQLPQSDEETYPNGTQGTEKGNVIKNFELVGYANPSESTGELIDILLEDFYNPTGEGVFPEDSPLGAGQPKPKALLINVSALWCEPCQLEAEKLLPGHYDELSPEGVQFLLVLVDGSDQGVAATETNLQNWTGRYDTRWPSAIDPQYAVGSLFKATAFPVNIVVDTTTMKIVEVIAGLPDEDGPLFQALETLIDE